MQQTLFISDEYSNERVDLVIAQLLPDYSRSQIQTWLKEGNILVNDAIVKPKTKCLGGEKIDIQAKMRTPLRYEPEKIALDIIYEDQDILIVNKPVGLVVHPGAGNFQHTLLNALLYHAPHLETLPRAGIIHRIDKNTSGLLAIAKSEVAYQALNAQLKKRTLTREYRAIVHGLMISGGSIDAPIGRHFKDRKRMAITDKGKDAITHYRIVEKYHAHTCLEVKLETGRTHQIRIHMKHLGYPIVGDQTYGKSYILAKGCSVALRDGLRHFKRQALHAYRLGLIHPQTHEAMSFIAPIPHDMEQLIQLLQEDKQGY
jgi:23S rRNA pseudouridine1911/1915/1917 synthase